MPRRRYPKEERIVDPAIEINDFVYKHLSLMKRASRDLPGYCTFRYPPYVCYKGKRINCRVINWYYSETDDVTRLLIELDN